MDTDASGKLHAIVATGGIDRLLGTTPAESVVLQRIDIAARTIEAQQAATLRGSQYVAFRYDAVAQAVVAGYTILTGMGIDVTHPNGVTTHRVALIREE